MTKKNKELARSLHTMFFLFRFVILSMVAFVFIPTFFLLIKGTRQAQPEDRGHIISTTLKRLSLPLCQTLHVREDPLNF